MEDKVRLDHLKEEIAHFENLILISEMAEIISHEIRNPMTTVRGFLQMFIHKPSLAKNRDCLEMMIEELDGVNSIINGLLAVNGGVDRRLQPYDLNQIIKSIVPLIQAMANKEEKFFKTKLQSIPKTDLDIKEIRHLILILSRNSFEAMSKEGTLSITTRQEGPYVVLEIEDNGKGIDPIVLEKIGTPFLTTKDKGTGLGLSVGYSICKRHDAEIEVKTSQKGTVFTIKFKTSPQSE